MRGSKKRELGVKITQMNEKFRNEMPRNKFILASRLINQLRSKHIFNIWGLLLSKSSLW